MRAPTRWRLLMILAICLGPAVVMVAALLLSAAFHRSALEPADEMSTEILWAPIISTALGGATLLASARRWWKFSVIPYLVVMYWVLNVVAAYFQLALLGEGP